ncbi:hypothetical protein KKB64_04240 [Patescibacteria group bacterium]|nr:hypothetical protein [Patescibacteria group bacterium]MBU1472965.1 hypothetical protein [Patescibacteria group bacterium]MBU2459687.1 hypothetical protein [Patescibacteria group bacterium]
MKRGHFYFAKKRTFLFGIDREEDYFRDETCLPSANQPDGFRIFIPLKARPLQSAGRLARSTGGQAGCQTVPGEAIPPGRWKVGRYT